MNYLKLSKFTLAMGVAGLTAFSAQAQFSPRNLAVLRAGDNTNNPWSSLGGAHQSPAFIDEFNPQIPITISGTNTGTNGPIYSVMIPTNDPVTTPPYAAMWFNGHAGTEGYLALSLDQGTLAWSGYGGDILADPGTPSGLNVPRGISVIDASGNTYIPLESPNWYGLGVGIQTNPRGCVSDNGTNNFFGSGSVDGNEWYTSLQAPSDSNPELIETFSSTRDVKFINGYFFTSLQSGDSTQFPPGIYDFWSINGFGVPQAPTALPEGDLFLPSLVVPASPQYPNVEGFDMNPQQNVAYMADNTYGIAKYVESNGNWTLACAFAITNNTSTNVGVFPIGYTGTFGLVVDWSGSYPVVFATTTEGSGGFANGNRVIRVDDNYNFTDGALHTNITVTTLATGWSANVALRGLAFTPDRRETITSDLTSQTITSGSGTTFTIQTTSLFPDSYFWYVDGTLDPSQTTAAYTVAAPASAGTYQVVVSNQFGSITSSLANLTITPSPTAPTITSPVPALNLTNAANDLIIIPVTVTGNTPMSYQWYQDSGSGPTLLSDGGDYTNSATSALNVRVSGASDAGSYYVVANNGIGSAASNLVATVAVVTPNPIIFQEPIDASAPSNGLASFVVNGYPIGVSYQWYQNGSPVSGSRFNGGNGPTLTISPVQESDNTTYYAVISYNGVSITSSVVTLTVAPAAVYSSFPYTANGQIYTQNFDSLPDPGTVSVNNSTTTLTAPVPANIPSNGPVNYDVLNPFDFAAPIASQIVTVGSNQYAFGGLNLPAMTGWYSGDSGAEQIQATTGDNTTGLIVSFGCTNAVNTVNPSYPTNNRALGMISSPASFGNGVFAFRVQNVTGQTLTNFNLSYVSELWRDTLTTNIMTNYFYVDTFASNNTPTNNWSGGLTNLFFQTNWPGVSKSNTKIYGTNAPISTTNMSFVNVPLTSTPWTPGAVLWIVWEEALPVSGGQGIGIDNLVFTSGNPRLSITQTNVSGVPSVTLSWPQMFTSAVLESSPTLGPSAVWTPVGGTTTVLQGLNNVTVPSSGAAQFYALFH